MGRILPSDGSSGLVKLINFVLRVVQFLIAIPIIAIYATQMRQGYSDKGYRFNDIIGDNNLSLGVAAAVISLVSALVYMCLLVFVDFKWVCRACPWDLIVMILFAALFGQMKKHVQPGNKEYYEIVTDRFGIDGGRVRLMQDTAWVDLTAMLLWLITFLKGVACLLWGRVRGSNPKY